MKDKFFNTVRQVKVFGEVVDSSGNFPTEVLDELEKKPNQIPNLTRFAPMPKSVNLKGDNKSLDELAREIAERGNDMQTTHSKDGLKVFEVSKKLITVIRS